VKRHARRTAPKLGIQDKPRLDHPRLVRALALKNLSSERFVFVGLDNCKVRGAFMEPVLREIE